MLPNTPIIPTVNPDDTVKNIQAQLAQQKVEMPTVSPLSQNTASMIAPHGGGIFDAIGQWNVGQQQAQAERERNAQNAALQQAKATKGLMEDKLAKAKQVRAHQSNINMYKAFVADPKKKAWMMERFGDLSEGIMAGTVNVSDLQNAYASYVGKNKDRAANRADRANERAANFKYRKKLMGMRSDADKKMSDARARKNIDSILTLHPEYQVSPMLQSVIDNNPTVALQELSLRINSDKTSTTTINLKPMQSKGYFNRIWDKSSGAYAQEHIINQFPSVEQNPKLMKDQMEMVRDKAYQAMKASGDNTGKLSDYIDMALSSMMMNNDKVGLVMQSNVDKGWVNFMGSDGTLKTINIHSTDVNTDPDILDLAKHESSYTQNPHAAIQTVVQHLLQEARQSNGGVVNGLSFVGKIDNSAKDVVQPVTSAAKKFADYFGFTNDGAEKNYIDAINRMKSGGS